MSTNAEDDTAQGEALVRRIMQMVAMLHARGLESRYLHCGMYLLGRCWRYAYGAMDGGAWPRRVLDPLQVFNSMDGCDDPTQIELDYPHGAPEVLASESVLCVNQRTIIRGMR